MNTSGASPVVARRYKTQRFEVARLLESAILEGRIKPGTRLPELLLSRQLGVSQASIREALQQVENNGLVVKYPNRGSFVISLTPEDLVAIYQLRQELEPMACALAAERMSSETLDALQTCISEMQEAAVKHDYRAHSNADLQFHRLIWEGQPNRYLEKLLKVICLPLFANDLVRRNPTAYLNYEQSTRQHTLILRALGTRDPSLVQKLVRRLIRRFLRQDLTDFSHLQGDTAESGENLDVVLASMRTSLEALPAFSGSRDNSP